MTYPPGLSGSVGGQSDGILFTLYNFTDQEIDVEASYTVVPPTPEPPGSGTIKPDTPIPAGTDPANPPTILIKVPAGVYNATLQPTDGPTYTVATDVVVGAVTSSGGGEDGLGLGPKSPPKHLPFAITPEQGQPNPMT
jgi:hypothetical protein